MLFVGYLWLWFRANGLREINLTIEESTVVIKTGDIFKQEGLKVIAFNEYFDTQVDERIIAQASLNGKFIREYCDCSVSELDAYIENYRFDSDEIKEINADRPEGKNKNLRLVPYASTMITYLPRYLNSTDTMKRISPCPSILGF